MDLEGIRRQVRDAIAQEAREGNLARALDERARSRLAALPTRERDQIVAFVAEYVEHAPALLGHLEHAAREQGVLDEVLPMLDAAADYFSAPLDLIPDRLGLLGLLDDAYVAHLLIQRVSSAHERKTGKPLIPGGLDEANGLVRRLIGERDAGLLEAAVDEKLGDPAVQRVLQTLVQRGTFAALGPDPIWGNARPGELAAARLGAWGVL